MQDMNPLIEGVYDRRMAAALARGAAAAYGEDREMEAWAESQRCDGCEAVRDERADTLGFVAANDDTVFVIFRGTRDLRNWITDLDARRVPMSGEWKVAGGQSDLVTGHSPLTTGLEVHEGFQRALESVWGKLQGVVECRSVGRENIFFAGHSLGGALAMLACARMNGELGMVNSETNSESEIQHSTFNIQNSIQPWLYTFGQPRVGNAAWARWYDSRLRGRSFRVVHAEDVVARMPWLLGLYRHAGTEIFYDALGRAHQDWPWWAKGPSDAAGLWREWQHGKVALLGDHHVRTYVGMLGRMQNAECRVQNAEC